MAVKYNKNSPIGVMDSGMGGISTLRALVKELPSEDFIYYGDDKNAPYGTKSTDEVISLAEASLAGLIDRGAKAVVIACNTATGAAAAYLREKYTDVPIIGAEPAIRPAVKYKHDSRVLVMATPLTLKSEKYLALSKEFANDAEIIGLPCQGIVELVESGTLEGDDVDDLLHRLLDSYVGKIDSIVLGCTHYPFLSKSISAIVGEQIPLFDGNKGIAAETKRRLLMEDMLTEKVTRGSVTFETSAGDEDTHMIAHMLMNL